MFTKEEIKKTWDNICKLKVDIEEVDSILDRNKEDKFTPVNEIPAHEFALLYNYCELSSVKLLNIIKAYRERTTQKEIRQHITSKIRTLLNMFDIRTRHLLQESVKKEKKKIIEGGGNRFISENTRDIETIFDKLGKTSKHLDSFFAKLREKNTAFKAEDYLDYLYILRFQYMEVSVKGYSETEVFFRAVVKRDAANKIERLDINENDKGQELVDVRVKHNNKPDIRLLLGLSKINEEIIKIESMMSIEITEEEMGRKYDEYLERTKQSQLERIDEVLDIGKDVL